MTKSYSEAARGPNRPAWIDDPEREKTDVLETPFTVEEVRTTTSQLGARA